MFISFIKAYRNYSHLEKVVGNDLVNSLAADIENLLTNKINALKELVTEAADDYENYTFDSDLNFNYLNSKKFLSDKDVYTIYSTSSEHVSEMTQKFRTITLTPDSQFNNIPVNFNSSTVQVPTTVFDGSPKIINGAYWTKNLDNRLRENYKKDKTLTWQYFCSSDGFFRVFPGMKWPRDNKDNNRIDLFDCRVRSWYLQAATCPKNVVILIDTSGSMQGLRMGIARSTVKQILNTLDDDDYFNIIRFADTVEYVDECFNGTMMPATAMNKLRLQEAIDDNVHARNKANLENVFEEAFRLLKREYERRNVNNKRREPLCNKAILLVTDGVPEHQIAEVFERHNWPNKTTRVFTFLIGREEKDDREVKWMACANKGFYSHISTLADVQENVQNYIKVLSRPLVIDRYHNTIWTPLYLDHLSALDFKKGLQFMISVASPVFDLKNTTLRAGNLLGVMGMDIPVKTLKKLIPAHKLGPNGFAFLINHNGYVVFHPDYRPHRLDIETGEMILNPNYKNMDLMDVILPANREKFAEMRQNMLSGIEGSKELDLLVHYDRMRRMVKRKYSFFYKKVTDTNFTLGIALPDTSLVEVKTGEIATSCLNESHIGIAPWQYCEDLDSRLTGRARIDRLIEIMENETLKKKCDTNLLNLLKYDSYITRDILKTWMRNGNDFKPRDKFKCATDVNTKQIEDNMLRNGIELVFVGTAGGITKYLTTRDLANPHFLLNNTSTIESDYYKRAIEGAEKLDSQPRYAFTYSFKFDKFFNINTTMITASAPIYVDHDNKMGLAAVVGFQMKYNSFEKHFFDTFTSTDDKMCIGDGPCRPCSNDLVNCYLVDNHGFVMASKRRDNDVGAFFGDIESEVMTELILKKNVFKGYNFTDYQAICEIKAYEKEKSSGTFLLNPLKSLLNGLVWTITEIGVLLSEFSFKSWWTSWKYAKAEEDMNYECVDSGLIGDYDIDEMGTNELVAYNQLNQLKMHCVFNQNRRNKTVGYRPCHKKFKLYTSNLKELYKHDGTIQGNISGDVKCTMECAPDNPDLCEPNCTIDKYY